MLRYLNNTLVNASNIYMWNLSPSPNCSHCNSAQTLGHVIASCKTSLEEDHYNWRHDSILTNLCSVIPSSFTVYGDLPGCLSPSIITSEMYHPDLLIKSDSVLWVLELTAAFETNIAKNFKRKQNRYKSLLDIFKREYTRVKYCNLSMSSIGTIGTGSKLQTSFDDLGLGKDETNHISKIINVCIRTTYYIFCCRKKEWSRPEFLTW